MPALADMIGLAGVGLALLAYFLLQHGSLGAHDRRFHGLNIAGGGLIVVSLLESWNLPSFLTESCWIAISAYGMVRHSSPHAR